MIILDTNIISEALRANPNVAVRAWLDRQRPSDLFLCAPVLAELRYGVERLPAGRRRSELERLLTNAEISLFGNRLLTFEREAAHEFGRIAARRAAMGRPILPMDAVIGAIAITNGMSIATRDIDGFAGLEIELIDPFES